MPDRVINTINTVDGPVCRPSVINLYEQSMDSVEVTTPSAISHPPAPLDNIHSRQDWWSLWKEFVFSGTVNMSKGGETPVYKLFSPIKRSKYI